MAEEVVGPSSEDIAKVMAWINQPWDQGGPLPKNISDPGFFDFQIALHVPTDPRYHDANLALGRVRTAHGYRSSDSEYVHHGGGGISGQRHHGHRE